MADTITLETYLNRRHAGIKEQLMMIHILSSLLKVSRYTANEGIIYKHMQSPSHISKRIQFLTNVLKSIIQSRLNNRKVLDAKAYGHTVRTPGIVYIKDKDVHIDIARCDAGSMWNPHSMFEQTIIAVYVETGEIYSSHKYPLADLTIEDI